MGGTDSPDNLIKLTIEEHAEAHRVLYEKYGNKFDNIAYLALSKQIGHEEANYMKLLGPKNWSEAGLENLRKLASKRTGEKNPFYGKSHTEKTLAKLREKRPWTKDAAPEDIAYTKEYKITYPDGSSKNVYGLKSIAKEFQVSIANVHATIGRINKGVLPKRGKFKNIVIQEIK